MKTPPLAWCPVLFVLGCSSPGAGSTGVAETRATEPAIAPSASAPDVASLPRSAAPPASAAPVDGPCERDGCRFDDQGACVVDDRPPELRSHAPETTATCTCVAPDQRCRSVPLERIPCKTVRDCWIDRAPRTHPVARPPALRGRDFAPCKDGEVAPACGTDGFCAVGPAFKC